MILGSHNMHFANLLCVYNVYCVMYTLHIEMTKNKWYNSYSKNN